MAGTDQERIRQLEAENAELRAAVAELKALVAGLQRQLFGRKTEKMPSVEKELRDRGEVRPDPGASANGRCRDGGVDRVHEHCSQNLLSYV